MVEVEVEVEVYTLCLGVVSICKDRDKLITLNHQC
jgi:hypothetical protein